MNKTKYIIGIDEAGRGPLAGPVSVGLAMVSEDFDWGLLKGVNDSKKLSPKKRELIFEEALKLKKENLIDFAVFMVSAKDIDKFGIVPAIRKSLINGLKKLCDKNDLDKDLIQVKLDGGLKAPEEYLHQETIIKGDSKELTIGLASIAAKVSRDRYMEKISKDPMFSRYNFDIHKGYGTKAHRESISEFGLSSEHRSTFCRNITFKQ